MTTWVDLEGVMLSEIIRQRMQYIIISLICEIKRKITKHVDTKNVLVIELVGAGQGGVGKMGEGGQRLQNE